MPRARARFRLSIRDKELGTHLKVELIPSPGTWGERRFKLRVNGREPAKIKEASLTEVFERLRRWVVAQCDKPAPPATAPERK